MRGSRALAIRHRVSTNWTIEYGSMSPTKTAVPATRQAASRIGKALGSPRYRPETMAKLRKRLSAYHSWIQWRLGDMRSNDGVRGRRRSREFASRGPGQSCSPSSPSLGRVGVPKVDRTRSQPAGDRAIERVFVFIAPNVYVCLLLAADGTPSKKSTTPVSSEYSAPTTRSPFVMT